MIDLPHEKGFELLSTGQTVGVYQVESQGMASVCKRLKPQSLEEVSAILALYRPGPMQFVDEYILRKWGKPYTVLVPCMEPILRPTYGLMIYQEQIMSVVRAVAGMSLAQADILRRAIGKKKRALLEEQQAVFTSGCEAQGFGEEVATELWAQIETFAEYGFNKSHSMAYAVVTLETATLKACAPVEFMVALLNREIGNAERIQELLTEARRMGIPVLPPDINKSRAEFSAEVGENGP